jgi:glycosyltransferase involved in cell wall biosynthesis
MMVGRGLQWPLSLRGVVSLFFGEGGLYRFHKIADWLRAVISPTVAAHVSLRHQPASSWDACEVGINVSGAISAEGGVAEALRQNIRAISLAKIPHALHDIPLGCFPRRRPRPDSTPRCDTPFNFNLVHVNANRFHQFYRAVGSEYFDHKYTIGYWVWELPRFPEQWHDRFACVDEVWTPSRFSCEALRAVAPIPVICIPHPVEIRLNRSFRRSEFGIKEDAYVFMFIFDYYSTFARKNPIGVLEAFKQAFLPSERVQLVVKFYNADINPVDCKRLARSVGNANVLLLNQRGSRQETLGLLSVADAYVSLHRSEGFGLSIAEAMALGKPVIATNYSGNTDYLNDDLGFPVSYSLRELEKTYGVYEKGNVWAEPNIDEAAHWMRYVFNHQEQATDKGARAAISIGARLAPSRIGCMMGDRLTAIIDAHRRQRDVNSELAHAVVPTACDA